MRNILLAAVSFLGMSDGNPVITLDPVPPAAGAQLTIKYTGKVGTVLNLDWHPSGTPPTVTIGANGEAVVDVPTGASSLIVSDPTGGAQSQSTTVTP